jgi:hypothetical protein
VQEEVRLGPNLRSLRSRLGPKLSPSAVALALLLVPRKSVRLVDPIPSDATQVFTVFRDQWTAADLTGRFPVPSYKGHEYILIFAHHGYIHYVPMKSRTSSSYVHAFRSAFTFFASFSHPVTFLVLDNETSSNLTALLRSQKPTVRFQHVPPLIQQSRAGHPDRKKSLHCGLILHPHYLSP